MLTVNHFEIIRRKVLLDGHSQRDVARELGHSYPSGEAQAAGDVGHHHVRCCHLPGSRSASWLIGVDAMRSSTSRRYSKGLRWCRSQVAMKLNSTAAGTGNRIGGQGGREMSAWRAPKMGPPQQADGLVDG